MIACNPGLYVLYVPLRPGIFQFCNNWVTSEDITIYYVRIWAIMTKLFTAFNTMKEEKVSINEEIPFFAVSFFYDFDRFLQQDESCR
jgi:hypothetical protein